MRLWAMVELACPASPQERGLTASHFRRAPSFFFSTAGLLVTVSFCTKPIVVLSKWREHRLWVS